MMLDLEAIKARIASAIDGPWWVEPEHLRRDGKRYDAFIAYGSKGDPSETYDLYDAYNVDTDYDFIAHARMDIPALVARIEELQRMYEPDVDRRPINAVGVPQESIREAQRLRELD